MENTCSAAVFLQEPRMDKCLYCNVLIGWEGEVRGPFSAFWTTPLINWILCSDFLNWAANQSIAKCWRSWKPPTEVKVLLMVQDAAQRLTNISVLLQTSPDCCVGGRWQSREASGRCTCSSGGKTGNTGLVVEFPGRLHGACPWAKHHASNSVTLDKNAQMTKCTVCYNVWMFNSN